MSVEYDVFDGKITYLSQAGSFYEYNSMTLDGQTVDLYFDYLINGELKYVYMKMAFPIDDFDGVNKDLQSCVGYYIHATEVLPKGSWGDNLKRILLPDNITFKMKIRPMPLKTAVYSS